MPNEQGGLAKDISKQGGEGATWSLLAADSKMPAGRKELKQQFPSDGEAASQGDIWQCLETFLVVETGEVATGI